MNYPVTTPFGQVPGYPLNNGFHNGIDYGYPMGTPVVVNGVAIGLSNNTGSSTGPHLHVGKYVNGQVQNPGVGNGFQFNSATIFDTGYDNTDGNYVRITGDGALWNYLHLEKVLVTKGQELKGEDMIDLNAARRLVRLAFYHEPADDSFTKQLVGKDIFTAMDMIEALPERRNMTNKVNSPDNNVAATELKPGLYRV